MLRTTKQRLGWNKGMPLPIWSPGGGWQLLGNRAMPPSMVSVLFSFVLHLLTAGVGTLIAQHDVTMTPSYARNLLRSAGKCFHTVVTVIRACLQLALLVQYVVAGFIWFAVTLVLVTAFLPVTAPILLGASLSRFSMPVTSMPAGCYSYCFSSYFRCKRSRNFRVLFILLLLLQPVIATGPGDGSTVSSAAAVAAATTTTAVFSAWLLRECQIPTHKVKDTIEKLDSQDVFSIEDLETVERQGNWEILRTEGHISVGIMSKLQHGIHVAKKQKVAPESTTEATNVSADPFFVLSAGGSCSVQC